MIMNTLAIAYRAYRQHGQIPARVALQLARNYVRGVDAWRAAIAAWQAAPKGPRPIFPPLPADDIAGTPSGRIDMDSRPRRVPVGHVADMEGATIYAPAVHLLPHGRWTAGYIDSGPDYYVGSRRVFRDASDAWAYADAMAYQDAELARDADERFQAASAAYDSACDARERIRACRAAARRLIADIRQSGTLRPAVCAALRNELAELRRDVRDAIATIRDARERIDDCGLADEFAV